MIKLINNEQLTCDKHTKIENTKKNNLLCCKLANYI